MSVTPGDFGGLFGGLFGDLFQSGAGALGGAAEASAGIAKFLRVATDRGILIRTGVAFVGAILMLVGILLFFREPVARGLTTAVETVK